VRPSDLGAYGVELERSQARGDAFVDVELAPEALHVRRAEGVSRIWVTPGALGTDKGHLPPIELDTPNPSLTAIWGTR
jgi:hypothetical protein